jgi:hypothetical protein
MQKLDYEYITIVGGELSDKISHSEFKSIVESILDDPIGWKQYNIHFTYIKGKTGSISIEDAKLIKYPILKIYLRGENETDKICGMRGLSCTRFKQSDKGSIDKGSIDKGSIDKDLIDKGSIDKDLIEYPIDIIINYKNWMGGSKSTLSIMDYHKYIINHEVGHWLGLEHSKCPLEECKKRGIEAKDCPASIMQQMSKGLKHLAPCGKETCTPLPPDWGVDNPHREKKHMHDDSGDNIDNIDINDSGDNDEISLKTISIDGISTIESNIESNTAIFKINMSVFIIFIIILLLVIIIVIFLTKMVKINP